MKALVTLSLHVTSRLEELAKNKESGRKVVGYTPGGYLPEELILACGAIPIGMIRGGDQVTVENSVEYTCRWYDPFYRAQVVYLTTPDDPFYSALDLLVLPVTDSHSRIICDSASVFANINLFQFGVPHKKEKLGFDYYCHGLNRLKVKLETFTGVSITNDRLREAIALCNRERQLFRQLSIMRKSNTVPIKFQDYLFLHHASYVADKQFMVQTLESVLSEVKSMNPGVPEGPRLLLTASTLAYGDTKVPRLVEEAGGSIVIEEVGECVRPYWHDVSCEGDLLENIAETYFMKRVPPAWFRPGRERLDFICKLAKDFNVQGVIWYHLMFREPYKLESHYFPNILREATGLNMLLLESDYSTMEPGPMRTKIETYLQTLRRS